MKRLFLQSQDELIQEWMDEHPNGTEEQAARAVENRIYEHACMKILDRADMLRDREKYRAD